METKMITYIALVATLCVVLVNSQQGLQGPPPAGSQGPPPAGSQGPPPAGSQGPPPASSQGPPPAVAAAFQKLQTDVEGFIANKTIDDSASQQTIIADIQAVFDAVKANITNPPPAVTAKFTKVQTDIDAMKSAGKVDPRKISEIANGCSAMFSSQSMTQESVPGAEGAGPGAGAGAGTGAGAGHKKGNHQHQQPKLHTH